MAFKDKSERDSYFALVAESLGQSPTEEGLREVVAKLGVKLGGPTWAALRKRLGLSTPPKSPSGKPRAAAAGRAVPGHFTDALRMADHVSKLNDEEAKLEARLIEIREEKAKYKDVAQAMEVLRRKVEEAK